MKGARVAVRTGVVKGPKAAWVAVAMHGKCEGRVHSDRNKTCSYTLYIYIVKVVRN
jgi:hypothetical protein